MESSSSPSVVEGTGSADRLRLCVLLAIAVQCALFFLISKASNWLGVIQTALTAGFFLSLIFLNALLIYRLSPRGLLPLPAVAILFLVTGSWLFVAITSSSIGWDGLDFWLTKCLGGCSSDRYFSGHRHSVFLPMFWSVIAGQGGGVAKEMVTVIYVLVSTACFALMADAERSKLGFAGFCAAIYFFVFSIPLWESHTLFLGYSETILGFGLVAVYYALRWCSPKLNSAHRIATILVVLMASTLVIFLRNTAVIYLGALGLSFFSLVLLGSYLSRFARAIVTSFAVALGGWLCWYVSVQFLFYDDTGRLMGKVFGWKFKVASYVPQDLWSAHMSALFLNSSFGVLLLSYLLCLITHRAKLFAHPVTIFLTIVCVAWVAISFTDRGQLHGVLGDDTLGSRFLIPLVPFLLGGVLYSCQLVSAVNANKS